jgi:adenylate cyclase
VDSPGDNLLAEFSSVVDAVQCAVAVQNEIQARNTELPDNRRMEFRIGINLGDVIDEEDRIYGDGVNIAARLESMADPGGICVSKTAFDQIETKLPLGYEYLGEQSVKNILKPVGAYRVLMKPDAAGKVIGEKRFLGRFSRRTAMAVIIILVIVAGGLIGWNIYLQQSKKVDPASLDKMAYPLPDKPSIAVLPFDNLSGDPEQEYFSDGFTEQIITSLSMVPKVFVIARNSTFTYKNKAVKVQQVAEDLGVRYVLEGSIQKKGQRVRITAQLIDAISGRHLWAERYDRELKDIFALQDEITIRIITELRVKLTDGEQARLLYKGTENLQAYLKYLQGLEYVQIHTKENNALARGLAEEVIAIDPEFPQAYTLLGTTYWMDLYLGSSKSPKLLLKKAIELNKKAISLNDSIPKSHSHMGWLYTLAGKHDDAIAECERAISLDPNSADAQHWMGHALRYSGRHEEAVRSAQQALRLNPIPPSPVYRSLGLTYLFVGKYEEAIAAFKKSLDQSPNDLLTHFSLACGYSLADRNEDAQAKAQKVIQINPNFSLKQFAKRLTYKNQADRELIVGAASKAGLPD